MVRARAAAARAAAAPDLVVTPLRAERPAKRPLRNRDCVGARYNARMSGIVSWSPGALPGTITHELRHGRCGIGWADRNSHDAGRRTEASSPDAGSHAQ